MADSGLGMFFLRIGCLLVNVCTLFLAVPFTSVMYYNAWASKVDIDGRSLKFTGNAGGFLVTWVKTLLLSTITFGIYYILIGRKNDAMGRFKLDLGIIIQVERRNISF